MRNKHDNKIKQYFLILYQGLKHESFYWEFINILRKFLVLAALLFPKSLKIMFGATILVITGRIQFHLKPYKNDDNNNVEMITIITGVFTIFSSLIYEEETEVGYIENLVLVLTILLNIIFFLQWMRLFCQMYKDKYKIPRIVGLNSNNF